MSRNEIILGAVALVLVGFSLFVSLVVPRRRPDFPGERIGLFVIVAVLLVVAMLGTVELFGEEEGAESEPAAETEGPAGSEPSVATEGGDDTGGETEGGDAGGDAARGEELFASEGCGSCHTFEAAGTSGTAGPNLDEAAPEFDAAVEQITNGGGGMPPYGGSLSEEDIRALAAFVIESRR